MIWRYSRNITMTMSPARLGSVAIFVAISNKLSTLTSSVQTILGMSRTFMCALERDALDLRNFAAVAHPLDLLL